MLQTVWAQRGAVCTAFKIVRRREIQRCRARGGETAEKERWKEQIPSPLSPELRGDISATHLSPLFIHLWSFAGSCIGECRAFYGVGQASVLIYTCINRTWDVKSANLIQLFEEHRYTQRNTAKLHPEKIN